MKASELIARLQYLLDMRGDWPVMLDTNPLELVGIEDVDTDCEEDVIVIWAVERGEAK